LGDRSWLMWQHFFPTTANYVPLGGPDWFRDALPSTLQRETRVLVAWERSRSTLPALTDYIGVLIVNPRGVGRQELRKAGFPVVRRFAVLPGIASARWLIPLETRAVHESAFSLYTPYKRLARGRLGVTRALIRLNTRLWYRDQLLLGSRDRPALEAFAASLTGSADIRCALSAGTGGPARKATALFLPTSGKPLAVAKIAETTVSERLIAREANVLDSLPPRFPEAGLSPRLLFQGTLDGRHATLQSYLEGDRAGIGIGSLERRFLAQLSADAKRAALETEAIRALLRRVERLSPQRPALLSTLNAVLPDLANLIVRRTIVHGDFAPWNLREHGGRLRAFDWEYAVLDGLPWMDELHHRLRVGLLLGNWSTRRALEEVRRLMAVPTPDMTARARLLLSLVYLINSIATRLEDGANDQDQLVQRHTDLLAALVSEWSMATTRRT
jgi:hypothetical protein